MRHILHRLIPCAIVILVSLGPPRAMATMLTIKPTPKYSDTAGGVTITASVPKLLNEAINAKYMKAFDTWNATLAMVDRWTLVDGADFGNDTKFEVSIYKANVVGGVGELEVEIKYTKGAGALDPIADGTAIKSTEAVWTQAIESPVKAAGALPGNPYLDNPNPAMKQLGPPAYPFQYTGSDFYDKPTRSPDTSWYGWAYLSTVDYTAKKLTVYDGVEYGFTVKAIPEPSTLTMGATGILLIIYSGWRRRRTS